MSQDRSWNRLLVPLLTAMWLTVAAPLTASAGPGEELETGEAPAQKNARVGCEKVVSETDAEAGVAVGQSADLATVAKHLGTSTVWVERCLESYGRRTRRLENDSAESREFHLDQLEGDEAEEQFPEDKEEPGVVERKEAGEEEKPLRPKDYYRYDTENEQEEE